MMPILLASILFYYLNGELNGAKPLPDWLTEKVEVLESFLDSDQLEYKETEERTNAMLDLLDTAELWGFINGIRFMSEVFKEI